MSHRYGFVTPAARGHLNPMVVLALKLIRRGHRVVDAASREVLLVDQLCPAAGTVAERVV